VNSNVVFILSALSLTLFVVMVLMWSLLRTGWTQDHPQDQANARAYRQQLLDLENEHAQGLISQSSFETTRVELLGRLLEDTSPAPARTAIKSTRPWVSATLVAISLPVIAMFTYLWLGQPQGLDSQTPAPAEFSQQADLETMAIKLAEKLNADPGHLDRWVMLARTYRALNQFDKSIAAYQKALEIKMDADIALERAEVVAQRNGGDFSGEPWAVIQQVLAKNSRHFNGLLLAGSASYAEGNFKKAIQYWQQARSQEDANPEDLKDLDVALSQAREKVGASAPGKPAPSVSLASGALLSGRVSIDPSAHVQIAPTDVVFVYATPTDGQKMPLAIVRKTADSLPFDFILDDSTSMNSAFKLSSQTTVMLKVRISKSGEAITRSGDWMGVMENVAVGSRNLKLVVNQRAP
jgi:cytochrome c-type biogenesis protein CcmH